MLDALRKAGMPEKAPGAVQEKPSIAVLPFENLSPDPEQEYFSDGLSEELINKLAQVKDIGVRLAIWDLGGQKMFQSMRKYYLQGAAGAIIVYDVTEPNSFKNIEKMG